MNVEVVTKWFSGSQPDKTFDVFSVEEWTLSNQEKEKQASSVTTTTAGTPEKTETSLEMLTPREEKVIRMTHGLSEDDSRALQFGLGASRDANMKLALIESQLSACLATENPENAFDDDRPSPAELISAWLDEE